MKLRKATQADARAILALYKSLVGTEYCAWTEAYPDMQEIDFDLSREALYCLEDEMTMEILAVISVDQDEMVEELECWTRDRRMVELSRLGVSVKHQNKGLAGQMIIELMQILKKDGFEGRAVEGVHFLVAQSNIKAQKAYDKLQCNIVGQCSLFGEEWFCYEKLM